MHIINCNYEYAKDTKTRLESNLTVILKGGDTKRELNKFYKE